MKNISTLNTYNIVIRFIIKSLKTYDNRHLYNQKLIKNNHFQIISINYKINEYLFITLKRNIL